MQLIYESRHKPTIGRLQVRPVHQWEILYYSYTLTCIRSGGKNTDFSFILFIFQLKSVHKILLKQDLGQVGYTEVKCNITFEVHEHVVAIIDTFIFSFSGPIKVQLLQIFC